MEVILSTAFGVKAETQTVENDPITESAKKAMAPNPVAGLLCKYFKIYKRGCGKGDNRELKQPRRRQQQKPHKFAYLTMKNSIFARFARAFFIF